MIDVKPACTCQKILHIDDDPALVTALAVRLSQWNTKVVSAFFCDHGIWLAVKESPDVIITDMRMPQGDGGDLVENLKGRSDTAHIPVIVLTGSRDLKTEQRMRALGVESYLHKPVDFEILLSVLQRLVHLEVVERG